MNPFAKALRRIDDTILMASQHDIHAVAHALAEGDGRLAIAVGSGPFLAVAHYFARCRATLGLGTSLIMTPMEFILDLQDRADADIWLFGASAEQPDMQAAFRSATAKRNRAVWSISTYQVGGEAASFENAAIPVPIPGDGDGLLSVHSTVAMVSVLLFASDSLTERPVGARLADHLVSALSQRLLTPTVQITGFNADDSVFLLHDPDLKPIAMIMEAYMWQAGIGPVQRSDLREFASTQFGWSSKHAASSFVLALTTCESDLIWQGIRGALPLNSRNQAINCGDGGRFANASGMLRGLMAVSQMGLVANDIDSMNASTSAGELRCHPRGLAELVSGLTPAVMHKAEARHLHDHIGDESQSLQLLGRNRLQALEAARFAAIVLDYDGTIVPNEPAEARFGPPPQAIIEQLVRLADDGVKIGIATGRGGSAGRQLRAALPERLHSELLMGYFNGAHIQMLDVDVSTDLPKGNGRAAEVAEWVASSRLLLPDAQIYSSHFQVTIRLEQIVDPKDFATRMVRSQHTFDVIPTEASKLAVMRRLAKGADGEDRHILAIGDSGSPLGNDHELLSMPYAISVDRVCGAAEGPWTLFGYRIRGPEALHHILISISVEDGAASLDLASLGLA
jgi:hypothetical protein